MEKDKKYRIIFYIGYQVEKISSIPKIILMDRKDKSSENGIQEHNAQTKSAKGSSFNQLFLLNQTCI